jgi:YggT family protein
MIRLILAIVFANYFNPVTQVIVKLTNPIINPTRKILPNLGRLETATLLWIFLLEIIKYTIVISLASGLPNILGLVILAVVDSLKLVCQLFFYAIIVQAILSLVQPYSPATQLLYSFCQPLLRPFQRIIPPVSGLDLSPIPVLILLQFALMLIAPLYSFGLGIALS